jgi:hypothetical protein
MVDLPCLLFRGAHTFPSLPLTPPTPYPWTPLFLLKQWLYTDGSNIKGQCRLGAAVAHVPSCTTIYIDAGGTNETRAIMRVELMVIHTALDKFVAHK